MSYLHIWCRMRSFTQSHLSRAFGRAHWDALWKAVRPDLNAMLQYVAICCNCKKPKWLAMHASIINQPGRETLHFQSGIFLPPQHSRPHIRFRHRRTPVSWCTAQQQPPQHLKTPGSDLGILDQTQSHYITQAIGMLKMANREHCETRNELLWICFCFTLNMSSPWQLFNLLWLK